MVNTHASYLTPGVFASGPTRQARRTVLVCCLEFTQPLGQALCGFLFRTLHGKGLCAQDILLVAIRALRFGERLGVHTGLRNRKSRKGRGRGGRRFGQGGRIQGELDGIRSRTGSQVVHAGLQTGLPTVEMHGSQLGGSWIRHEDIETAHHKGRHPHISTLQTGHIQSHPIPDAPLTLVDEGTAISSHIHQNTLSQLPCSLVQVLQILRDCFDVLNTAIVGNELVNEIRSPQTATAQITDQVLQRAHPPRIDSTVREQEVTTLVTSQCRHLVGRQLIACILT